MRGISLAVLVALVAVALTVQAQPPVFTEPYQVRGAVGDIPTTETVEPTGFWNLEQRLAWPFDNASNEDARTLHFAIPTGATLSNVTCDCSAFQYVPSTNAVTVVLDARSPSGTWTVRVTTRQPFDSTLGFSLIAPFEAGPEQAFVFYVPLGHAMDGAVDLDSPGTSTDGTSTIQFARFGTSNPRPTDLWFTLHPATNTPDATPGNAGFSWLFLLVGVVAGAAVWAVLVSRGLVQTKSRKQVAGTAAHIEVAATGSAAVLEGKKRALLAALKDVELARQANEMPVDVYDVVKADLKKQAVTVMRALEASASTEPKP